MKIGTNPVGNYNPVFRATQLTKAAELNKVQEQTTINKKEKAFFSQMYPQNKDQIMNHHFYMKDGNMSGVMVGSLFDRKG